MTNVHPVDSPDAGTGSLNITKDNNKMEQMNIERIGLIVFNPPILKGCTTDTVVAVTWIGFSMDNRLFFFDRGGRR